MATRCRCGCCKPVGVQVGQAGRPKTESQIVEIADRLVEVDEGLLELEQQPS
jgi:hypothetical protein